MYKQFLGLVFLFNFCLIVHYLICVLLRFLYMIINNKLLNILVYNYYIKFLIKKNSYRYVSKRSSISILGLNYHLKSNCYIYFLLNWFFFIGNFKYISLNAHNNSLLNKMFKYFFYYNSINFNFNFNDVFLLYKITNKKKINYFFFIKRFFKKKKKNRKKPIKVRKRKFLRFRFWRFKKRFKKKFRKHFKIFKFKVRKRKRKVSLFRNDYNYLFFYQFFNHFFFKKKMIKSKQRVKFMLKKSIFSINLTNTFNVEIFNKNYTSVTVIPFFINSKSFFLKFFKSKKYKKNVFFFKKYKKYKFIFLFGDRFIRRHIPRISKLKKSLIFFKKPKKNRNSFKSSFVDFVLNLNLIKFESFFSFNLFVETGLYFCLSFFFKKSFFFFRKKHIIYIRLKKKKKKLKHLKWKKFFRFKLVKKKRSIFWKKRKFILSQIFMKRNKILLKSEFYKILIKSFLKKKKIHKKLFLTQKVNKYSIHFFYKHFIFKRRIKKKITRFNFFNTTHSSITYNNFFPVYNLHSMLIKKFKKIFKILLKQKYLPGSQFYVISFFEFFLKKKIFIKSVNNRFFNFLIKKKKNVNFKNLYKIYIKNKKSVLSWVIKKNKFNLFEILEIIFYSFYHKDLTFLKNWFLKNYIKLHYKAQKKFLLFFKIAITDVMEYYKYSLRINGFYFLIKGKIGVTSNAKKKKIFFRTGPLNKSSKNQKIDFQQGVVKTSVGTSGFLMILTYM